MDGTIAPARRFADVAGQRGHLFSVSVLPGGNIFFGFYPHATTIHTTLTPEEARGLAAALLTVVEAAQTDEGSAD